MLLTDLPDDILVFILSKYLNLNDLIQVSATCTRLQNLFKSYKIWKNVFQRYPLLDFSYPFGFNEFQKYSESYTKDYGDLYRLKKYLNLKNKKCIQKIFYVYNQKMFPSIQIGDETSDTLGNRSVYLTNDNEIVWIDIKQIQKHVPIENSFNRIKSNQRTNFKNSIKLINRFQVFNSNDIRKFKKKDQILVCSSENSIKSFLFNENEQELLNQIKEQKGKINCVDMSVKYDKIVYGCTNGSLKVKSVTDQKFSGHNININDRIIRCSISPLENDIAVGTAGINPYNGNEPCPLRIYDFESLIEKQVLKNPGRIKIGAGILALSYIDENLIISAGYDTFIRIYDLRSNQCVQSLEEPEDMSIYTICCSKFYGLLSGNDRQSIVRYWDRRVNKVISSFRVSNSNSSIYSLACTPDSFYACWDRGVTLIDFR